ncbi:MAG: hypothetical protein ABI639_11015 [Thermoanaerobaculia bacterium]
MKVLQRLLLPALMLLLVVGQLRRSSDLTRAQHLLYSVDRRTVAMLRANAVDKTKLRGHLEALADAQRLDPAEVATPTLQGSQHLMLGELEPARQAYFVANRLESRPEILLNLGKVWYSSGGFDRAVRYFALAVRVDPHLLQEVPESMRQRVSDALRSQDDAHGTNEN